MKNISDYITYDEATGSQNAERLGINNKPDEGQLKKMITLALKVFEPLRAGLGGYPIQIASFFRCDKLNAATPGAARNSQHIARKGAAFDLKALPGTPITNKDIFLYIKDNLEFDQLIWEYGDNEQPRWIHCSYNEDHNRGQVLKTYYDKTEKRVKYLTFNF